jgi:hypothetical protein
VYHCCYKRTIINLAYFANTTIFQLQNYLKTVTEQSHLSSHKIVQTNKTFAVIEAFREKFADVLPPNK